MALLPIDTDEQFKEAVAAFRKRQPMSREAFDELSYAEREHAFTVAQVTRARILQQVLDAVDTAIEQGTTLETFKDNCADELIESWGGEIPGRIENVFRTNIMTAYNEGRHAVNSAPAVKEARPYWRFDDVPSDRECEECGDCGGTVLAADDPWWETHHPPLHYQCRCIVTALSPEEAEEEGIDDEGPDLELEDEDFGHEPSAEGEDWAPDLENIDPELREAIEEHLARR